MSTNFNELWDSSESSYKTKKSSPSSTSFSNLWDELEVPKKKGTLRKAGRLATQYGIGAAEMAAFPYEIAVSPLSSKGAQQGEFRKNIFEDIERLSEQKQSIGLDAQDEKLLQQLISQIKSPEKTDPFVKTVDIGIGSLAEKSGDALGVDLKPEGLEEDIARIGGNLINPRSLLKAPNLIKNITNPAARQASKISSQWKSLENSVSKNPEGKNILNFAKESKLTPQEATLILHAKGKVSLLEKIAKKTKNYKNVVQGLKEKLGNNYEQLKELGRNGGYLDLKESTNLQNNLSKIVVDMRKTLIEGPDTASARSAIEKGIERLNNKATTIEDLINSRQGLKESINWRNVDRGDVIRMQADNAFLKSIKEKSPSIYKKLVENDKAYAKFKQFKGALDKQPNFVKFKGIPIPNSVLGTLAFAVPLSHVAGISAIKLAALKEGLQRLTTQFLINPKYQPIFKNFKQSLINGSKKPIKQAFLQIKKKIKEEDPDLYDQIDGLKLE